MTQIHYDVHAVHLLINFRKMFLFFPDSLPNHKRSWKTRGVHREARIRQRRGYGCHGNARAEQVQAYADRKRVGLRRTSRGVSRCGRKRVALCQAI